eukprot:1149562-Pelagomonas_calceolata.AAC.8
MHKDRPQGVMHKDHPQGVMHKDRPQGVMHKECPETSKRKMAHFNHQLHPGCPGGFVAALQYVQLTRRQLGNEYRPPIGNPLLPVWGSSSNMPSRSSFSTNLNGGQDRPSRLVYQRSSGRTSHQGSQDGTSSQVRGGLRNHGREGEGSCSSALPRCHRPQCDLRSSKGLF